MGEARARTRFESADLAWQTWAMIGAVLFLLGSSLALNYFFSESANLRRYASDIEFTLRTQEGEIDAIVQDTAFLRRRIFGLGKLPADAQREDGDKLQEISREDYNICLYEGDSLILWTNTRVFLPEHSSPARLAPVQARLFQNGYYVVKRNTVQLFRGRTFEVIALIPIKNNYSLASEYLRNEYLGNPSIPGAVEISQVPTAFPVRAEDGTLVAYLNSSKKFHDHLGQRMLLGCHLLSFLLIGIWIHYVATLLAASSGSWAGGMFLVSAVVGLRVLMNNTEWVEGFTDLGVFAQSFRMPHAFGSLGGMILNVLFTLWLSTFFHKHYRLSERFTLTPTRRWLATGLQYFAILVCAFALAYAFRGVIRSEELAFDFSNVFNLDVRAMLAIFAMLTLTFGMFLVAHRLMVGISNLGLSKSARLASLLGAVCVSLPLAYVSNCPLPLPQFYLGTFAFVVLYDMFIDSGESNILWLFFWLVVISLYSAAMLFTFNEERDLDRRIDYALVLADARDSLAEAALSHFVGSLRSNIGFQEALSQNGAQVPLRDVIPVVERTLIDNGYLYNNYSYRIYGYDAATDSSFFQGREPVEARAAMERLSRSVAVGNYTAYLLEEGRALRYIAHFRSELQREPTRTLVVEVEHQPRSPSRVFTELLVDERYRNLAALPDYDYAIYRQGRLVEEAGRSHALELRSTNLPEPGYYISVTDANYSSVIYSGYDGTVVLIGKDMGGYWRPMSLFSYLFVWCIMLTILLSMVNVYVEVLPRAVDITWLGKPDLKTKIQVGIIALVLLSFAMIGYVTVLYFHDSTDAYHDNRLNRKVASILRNTEHEVQLLSELTDIDRPSLERIIKPISEIHHMDVNLYDLKGNLLASSETDIYKRGIIAPKMGALAFQLLSKIGQPLAVQEESVGSLNFRTAYVPVRMPEGERIAYMGLPYYSKQRDLRDDVSSFMGTLLNVYVFLLLIAGVIAITVANSITRPLSELGAKIRRFKLDKNNEPLVWAAPDELGALIGEFNSMLSTVEQSARELADARRETAWREMAQQVAHEIKNPLTPMKLSIQYLKLAFERDPSQIEPLISRVSSTLIEQIDNLDSIASNFSTFARMPDPEPTYIDLSELVRSSYDLYREEDLDIFLEAEEGLGFIIFADKKLLMRVISNLIKNAIQAIPKDRRGRVLIRLEKQGVNARVTVADNGTGIPEEMQEKVFMPKFTTKSSGSGLGLAICRDIVKSADGRIYFKTDTGMGTEFFVEIPLADVASLVQSLHTDEATPRVPKAKPPSAAKLAARALDGVPSESTTGAESLR